MSRKLLTPSQSFFEINGVRLFTRRAGTGPLVVVLHGGPGAHHDYLLPQYDRLAQGRELFFYDQRGGGQSLVSRDTAVGWREHVADLDSIRDRLGLEQMTICGYSWGGLLAVLYLLEHPERVGRLALVSTASPTLEYRLQFEAEFARRMASPEIQREREALRASGGGLRERDPAAYQRRAFELSVAGYFRDFRNAKNLTPFRVTARTQQAVWESLGSYDLRPLLKEHASRFPPSRVVHGTYDPIPIAGSRELVSGLGAELIELPVGHCPHVEATEDFVRALNEFLPSA